MCKYCFWRSDAKQRQSLLQDQPQRRGKCCKNTCFASLLLIFLGGVGAGIWLMVRGFEEGNNPDLIYGGALLILASCGGICVSNAEPPNQPFSCKQDCSECCPC